ncbi:hypothetical protein NC996_07560 [Trichocoleus sp. ST-U2]
MDEAIENIKDAIRGYLYVQAKHDYPYGVGLQIGVSVQEEMRKYRINFKTNRPGE